MAAGPDSGKDLWGGMSTGVAISATLLSGILVWGAVGFLIDWLVGSARVFTGIGMVVGAAAAIYLVYLRYGRADEAPRDRARGPGEGRGGAGGQSR